MCQIALCCQCQKPGLLISTWSTTLCSITNRIDLVILEHSWRPPKACVYSFTFLESVPIPHVLLLSTLYSDVMTPNIYLIISSESNTRCIRFNLHVVLNPHMPILQEQFSCTACLLAMTDWSPGRAAEPRWANQSSSLGVLTTGWREGAIPCQQLKL